MSASYSSWHIRADVVSTPSTILLLLTSSFISAGCATVTGRSPISVTAHTIKGNWETGDIGTDDLSFHGGKHMQVGAVKNDSPITRKLPTLGHCRHFWMLIARIDFTQVEETLEFDFGTSAAVLAVRHLPASAVVLHVKNEGGRQRIICYVFICNSQRIQILSAVLFGTKNRDFFGMDICFLQKGARVKWVVNSSTGDVSWVMPRDAQKHQRDARTTAILVYTTPKVCMRTQTFIVHTLDLSSGGI